MSQPECDSFDALMALVRAGDQRAAEEVFKRFAQRLIALARSRLDRLLRQKVDPEDVVQSVYRSFFARMANGQFDLEGWDSLWALLVRITLRKCGHRVEYYRAASRDVKREVSRRPSADESAARWEPIARHPTPSEAAMLTETIEQLMRGLGDERHRRVLVLSLEGQAVAEISRQVGLSERTIKRVLDKVKARLERRLAETGKP